MVKRYERAVLLEGVPAGPVPGPLWAWSLAVYQDLKSRLLEWLRGVTEQQGEPDAR